MAADEHKSIMKKCIAFDKKMMADAEKRAVKSMPNSVPLPTASRLRLTNN